MANAVGLIRESIWRDRDFRALPRTAQATYFQILSQKDLDCAGVLTLHVDFLAKGCDEMTVENLWHDLKILEQARFIVVDSDTDELLIRSYARLVSAVNRNAWMGARKAAKMVVSPKIRPVLACELRRIGRADADELANDIDPGQTPSEPRPNPVLTPSPPRTPSERGSNPLSPDQSRPDLTYVGGWVGEDPPPTTCPKHPNGTDTPCGGCQTARKANEAWTVAHERRVATERQALRAAIDACAYCEPTGLRETPAGMTRCTHNPDTFDDEF